MLVVMRLLKYIVATRRPGCTSPSSVIFLLIPPLVRQPPTRRLYQPTDSAEEPIFYGVWATSPSDVWAVGSFAGVYHWDGSVWVNATEVVSGAYLFDIWGSGPDDVWAVGGTTSTSPSLIIHWDGSSWTDQSPGVTGGLRAIWGSGPNDIYAVGAKSGSSSLMLHFDGSTWESVTVPGRGMFGVWGTSSSEIWAVSWDVTPIILRYDGSSWIENSPSEHPTDWAQSVWTASPTDPVWLTGQGGTIWKGSR